MKRTEKFYELMDVVYAAVEKAQAYDSKPHSYGTKDLLYMTEAHLIDKIGKNPGYTITELAKATRKTKGAISQTVEKLVTKDLIRKISDPADNRRNILELTPDGETVFRTHREKDEVAFDRFLNRLDDYSTEEITRTKEIIGKIFKIDLDGNQTS